MELEDLKKFYKKIEPIIALVIVGLLISVAVNLPKQIKLNQEIKETCGWEDETVRCICEKNYVVEHEAINLGYNQDINFSESENNG